MTAGGFSATPRGERIVIGFFGLRNAGKSTLVNAFTGQDLAIVSDVAGTTTDPVAKAMEIAPLGPCTVIDTAGLDDSGPLGERRVEKTLAVLATCDVVVWVASPASVAENTARARFDAECRARRVPVVAYRREEGADDLKRRIAALELAELQPGLLDGLVKTGDRVLCVCPIDAAAPKGRLILPQVQAIRACLDLGATAEVCQVPQLAALVAARGAWDLVITDSQAFGEVAATLPADQPLTGFSILFARQKGDLAAYCRALDRVGNLRDGDRVLVAEGCTHRRQCGDIGTEKIPRALERLAGRRLSFAFASGPSFDAGLLAREKPRLVVQCGGCMLTRREMLRRIELASVVGAETVNYGILLAAAKGLRVAATGTVRPMSQCQGERRK